MRDQHKRKDVWHRKMRYGKKLCAAGLSICLLLTGCSGLPFGKDKSRDVYTPPKSTDVECTQEPEVIGMSDEDATYASLEQPVPLLNVLTKNNYAGIYLHSGSYT